MKKLIQDQPQIKARLKELHKAVTSYEHPLEPIDAIDWEIDTSDSVSTEQKIYPNSSNS